MFFALRRELCRVAGDAIIKTRADGNQEIAVLDRVVRGRDAVHAEHVHCQRMRGVAGAQRHQRGRDRDAVFVGKPPHRLGRVAH